MAKELIREDVPLTHDMINVSVKLSQKLHEINARMSELDRCFPFIDDENFYNERKSQLEKTKKQILDDARKFAENLEELEI